MARLESTAVAQEYPAPLSVVTAIASYLRTNGRTTICDPFGSDGRALNTLSTLLNVPSEHRYLAELKSTNVQTAIEGGTANAVAADSFNELKATPWSMGVVWNNPPFDWTNGGLAEKGQVGVREELRALRLVLNTSKLCLLVPGGIHVMIGPEDIMRRDDMRREMALWHDDMIAFTYPDGERHFREVIIIGIKRAIARKDSDEIDGVMDYINALLDAAEPITPISEPLFDVPVVNKKDIVWRSKASSNAQEAARRIVRTGGAFTSDPWIQARQQMRQFIAPPLAPFNAEQAAMMVASGKFNGQTVELNGEAFRVKGQTNFRAVSTKTQRDTGSATVTEIETIQVPNPMISMFNLKTGKTTIYDGTEAVMAFVSANADAFLRMAANAAPPMFNAETFNQTLWQVLEEFTSASGRKPRGQSKPGLVLRQKQTAAAGLSGLLNPHPLTGKPLKGVVLAMEQRCGKTPTSLAMAQALQQYTKVKPKQLRYRTTDGQVKHRAYTAFIPAPRLVVGKKATIRKALQGKGEFPAWYATAMDMLPTWKLFVVESAHDISLMMESAKANPETPHMGFIPLSMYALGPGWETGTPAIPDSAAKRDARFAQHEQEVAALARHLAGQATDAENESVVTETGVSERTRQRDAIVKPSYRSQQAYGYQCPDCGRVQLDPQDGAAIAEFAEMKDATCQWCGSRFAGWTRSVQAKDDAKTFSDWQNDFALNADGSRIIPWGNRPTANPRVPLAWFLSRRYKGQIDLLIFDEVHKGKGDGTAISDALFWGSDAAHKVVYLTGTVFGGNALDTFNIYWSIANPVLRRQFKFTDRTLFVDTMGIKKTITTHTRNRSGGGVLSGRNTTRNRTEVLPGLTINLLEMVLTQTVMTQLIDMGFDLVPLTERKVLLDMPDDVAGNYFEAASEYKAWLKMGRKRCASSATQMLWQYPYNPYPQTKPMRYEKKDWNTGTVLETDMYYPIDVAERVLPHHEWLADYITSERKKGRRVLIFATHTGADDLMPKTMQLVNEVAMRKYGTQIKSIALYSNGDSTGKGVDSGSRDVWFAEKAKEGYDVVMTNPACVDVGISLLDFPSIVFLEPHYSSFIVSQAMMRAWGPMQDKPCEVVFMAYRGTVSHIALSLLAKKLAAMATLKGSIAKALMGIAEFTGAMSMFEMIAGIVANASDTSDTESFAVFASEPSIIESGSIDPICVSPEVIAEALIEAIQDEALKIETGLFTTVKQQVVVKRGVAKGRTFEAEQFVMAL